MKINKDTLPKLTLKDLKIIGAICLMVLVVIISFGFIGKGCGGEEDSSKAETGASVENPTADGTNRSNLNVNVKMNIKVGKYYYLEIYLEGYKEYKFAKALNADAPTTSASFYASPGELTIYADLYKADSTGNKTEETPIGSDTEKVNIPDSLEDVNAYLTIKIDEDSGETEFVFTVAEVTANASINSAPDIAIISQAETTPDYTNKKVKTIVHFSANDSEEGDCCANDSKCEIVVETFCEDKAIAAAPFAKENVDNDAANDNKCEGSVSMPFPGQADFNADNIYNCRIEITVVDSGKTDVESLDPKYYVQATGTHRIKIDLPKEKFDLTEKIKEPEPEVPIDGLVGYWNFDEGSGKIVKDFSGNGLDGTIAGTTNWVKEDGATNGFLKFDGATTRVTVPHKEILNITGAVTMIANVKRHSSQNNYYTILMKGNWVGSAVEKSKRNYNLSIAKTGNFLGSYFSNGCSDMIPGMCNSISNVNGISSDTWYNVVSIIDTVNKRYAFYVDGAFFYEKENVVIMPELTTNTDDLIIGRVSSGEQSLYGALDEIRIYNRALDKNEIDAIYQVDKKKTGNLGTE